MRWFLSSRYIPILLGFGMFLVTLDAVEAQQPVAAADGWSAKVYTIDDRVMQADDAFWTTLITTVIAPESWQQSGGRGTIVAQAGRPTTLLITQRDEVHGRILELLNRVGRAIHSKLGQVSAPPGELVGLTPEEERLQAALREPTMLEFVETPLSDVVKFLEDFHKITIRIDEPAVKKLGKTADPPITKNLKGVSLRSALSLMLREMGAIGAVDHGALVITEPATLAKKLSLRLYRVDGLAATRTAGGPPEAAFDQVIQAITEAVFPKTWHKTGGRGTIAAVARSPVPVLAVMQTENVHRGIAEVLSQLRAAARGEPLLGPAEKRLKEALESPTSLEFVETPLQDVIDYMKDYHRIEIQLDCKPVDAIGLGGDTRVTKNIKKVRLRSALALMLRENGFTFDIEDEVLLIFPEEASRLHAQTRIYPIADLLADNTRPGLIDAEAICRIVTSSAASLSWLQRDSNAAISPFVSDQVKCLVTTQCGPVHQQIEDLLGALRCAVGAARAMQLGRRIEDEPGIGLPENRIRTLLKSVTAPISFVETPLADVVDYFADEHKIGIQIDLTALKCEKLDLESQITRNVAGVSLAVALEQMLGGLRLTHVVRDDVVLVTTPKEADRWLYSAVYLLSEQDARRVAHLDVFDPIENNRLIEAITASIGPKTWQKAGSRGTILCVPLGQIRALVITQTYAVHNLIADQIGRPGMREGQTRGK